MSMPRVAAAAAVAWCAAAGATAADRAPALTLVRSQNLTVVGQQSARTLRDVAIELEQFRAVLGGLIRNADKPLPVPTVVYVFDTHKHLEPFLPMHNGRPASLGGYFQRDEDRNEIAFALEGFDENREIIFHEYAHLLVRNAVRAIPVWLNEGLAEYYSTYQLSPGGKRADIGRPIGRHVLRLREQFMPVANLIAVDKSSELYEEGARRSIFYAEAWAATHYLMVERAGGPAAINAYVSGLAAGGNPDAVFAEAFGVTPLAFEKELRKYLGRPTFRVGRYILPDKMTVQPPSAPVVVPAAEAAAWLGDLQRRVRRTSEAAVRIEAAAAEAPDAAMPHLALALLRLEQERDEEAWPHFERASALAATDFLVQFDYGVALLRRAAAEEGKNAEVVVRSRIALTRAAALNPAAADTYAWLASAYMLGEARLGEALTAIRRAIDLAPGRLDYRLRYADIRILEGAHAEARAVLAELARNSGEGTVAERASQRLAVVDDYLTRVRENAKRIAEATAAAAADRARPGDTTRLAADIDTGGVELETDKPRETETDMGGPKLRAVRRGEERAYGDLVELECGAGVRVYLKVGSRLIVATANRMDDVAMTSFLPTKDFSVGCGRRQTPDAIYLTWRSAPQRTDGAATIVGTAVAIEFVPRGYTP
jgi:tetratricopeptide (TPR) repeat protein